MKSKYLSKLKMLLDQYNMTEMEKDDIVSDYSEMYDNWVEYGMSEDEVEEKLGNPENLVGELTEGYKTLAKVQAKKASSKKNKFIAITPFIALIIFFIVGFVYDGWVYGWTAFLLIPISAIVLDMKNDSHRITALMPFISLITFFVLGFVFTLWHPGWLVFLLIPIVAITVERKSIGKLNTLVSLSPLVALVVFLYIGFEYDLWVPGWTLFLIVPALGVLNEKNKLKVLLWEVLILGGVAGYLYGGYVLEEWTYALLAFAPLVIFGFTQAEINVEMEGMSLRYKLLVLVLALLYIALGFLTKEWGYFWLLFLLIPVYAIITEVKDDSKIIALMPFIALFIFYTLGWFFSLWAFSWLAFLLIPMVAIIKEA